MGHGTIINDSDGDGKNGFDEAICTIDTKKTSGELQNIIADDELDIWLSSIKSKKQLIMFESCFSGGIVDGRNTKNITLIDVNKNGRIVIMSTSPGKLGFVFPNLGWPISYLYGQSLSDQNCDVKKDGWISAEEAFQQVDTEYPVLEDEKFLEIINLSIPIATIEQYLIAFIMLKKIGMKPVARVILSGLWALFAYKIYQNEECKQYIVEMMKTQFLIKGAENNPNMVDDYSGELNLIKLL